MKCLATLFTIALLMNPEAKAGAIKELYTVAHEEIDFFYQATGQWSLMRVSNVEFVDIESTNFIVLSAKATIKNTISNVWAKETCLITFTEENNDFHSVNCF